MDTAVSLIDELEAHLKDGSRSERVNILQRVTDLFLANAKYVSEEQVEVFDEVMLRLIEKIEDQILASLSERLAAVDNSPLGVIAQLARHERIEVAGPVLEKSNRLSDIDLVEVAYTKSQAHLSAIAGRRQVSPAVAEVLVRRGDSEVALKLAANAGAAFSPESFSKLVRRALDNKTLAAKISDRGDIPPELYEYLVTRATDKVKRHLIATCKPAVRPKIETLLLKVSDNIVKHGVTAPATRSGWASLPKRDLTIMRSQLDEHIAAENNSGTIHLLAQLAEIPDDSVKNVVQQGAEDGLLIVCKAGMVSWLTVKAILKSRMWQKTPDEAQLKDISDRYYKLSTESAQRVLLFMKARKAMSAAEMSKLLEKA